MMQLQERRSLAITDGPFTPVDVQRGDGTRWTTYTRSRPWVLRSGILVVYLVGQELPCLVSYCTVIPKI